MISRKILLMQKVQTVIQTVQNPSYLMGDWKIAGRRLCQNFSDICGLRENFQSTFSKAFVRSPHCFWRRFSNASVSAPPERPPTASTFPKALPAVAPSQPSQSTPIVARTQTPIALAIAALRQKFPDLDKKFVQVRYRQKSWFCMINRAGRWQV